jgi:hypothetical protein
LKSCKKKWETDQEQLPKNKRRPVPEAPKAFDEVKICLKLIKQFRSKPVVLPRWTQAKWISITMRLLTTTTIKPLFLAPAVGGPSFQIGSKCISNLARQAKLPLLPNQEDQLLSLVERPVALLEEEVWAAQLRAEAWEEVGMSGLLEKDLEEDPP